MRVSRSHIMVLALAIAAAGCAGHPMARGPVAAAPGGIDNVVYGPTAPPVAQVPVATGRGLPLAAFVSRPVVVAPLATPVVATQVLATPVMAAPVAFVPPDTQGPYTLDSGDRLRVVIFGQDGLTNAYAVDAGGRIDMPLIGSVPARGHTPAGLAAEITAKLRNGYIREPSVAVEIESYRPFFILGEVAAPGQYPYVPNMSVESAVAIAGGFSPRAKRDGVTLTHTDSSGSTRYVVPLGTAISPGDTVLVGERWF